MGSINCVLIVKPLNSPVFENTGDSMSPNLIWSALSGEGSGSDFSTTSVDIEPFLSILIIGVF